MPVYDFKAGIERVYEYYNTFNLMLSNMAFQSPRHSQSFYQHDASTPPPPPPKPNNSSGPATPSTGPPLPPPPGQSQSHSGSQLAYPQNDSQADPYQLAVQPPSDGWLPEFVKDKAYVGLQIDTYQLLMSLQNKRST